MAGDYTDGTLPARFEDLLVEESDARHQQDLLRIPKLVYIAGPYRGSCGWEIECNIQAARALGAKVVHAGAYPVIPHSNTAHFDGLATDKFWLEATLELMRRCDAVLFTADWERSDGARAERLEAERLGLACFYDMPGFALIEVQRFVRGES